MLNTSVRRLLDWLPVSKRLLIIIWPFVVIVFLLVWLFAESMVVLGSTRSYSEGESNWSKGQKQAVFHLLAFAESGEISEYDKYLQAIAVPLAFKRFRVEMQKPEPDWPAVHQALAEGLTHPDDIEPGVQFFRRFHAVRPMSDVVKIWEEGDLLMDELVSAAEQLRAAIVDRAPPEQVNVLTDRIVEINSRLTPMAQRFTKSLGEASRRAQFTLMMVIYIAAALLVPVGVGLSYRSVKHNEVVERALRVSEERFNLAVEGSNDGLWDWNIETNELYYSPRFAQLLGYREGELRRSTRGILALVHRDDRHMAVRALHGHLTSDRPFDIELRMQTRAGDLRWFRARGQSVRNARGRAVRMAGSVTDTTDRRNAAAELFAEKERAQVTLESIADGVITTDIDGWIEYLNPVAEDLTGWKFSEARGLPLQAVFRLIEETTRQLAPNPIETVLREERTVEVPQAMLLVKNDGNEVPIVHSAAPIRNRAGEITGVVLVLHDVSSERQYAAKLSYQASHDSLTGLINRTEFEQRLGMALKSAAQIGRHHAVMYLDLDQFKIVNDTCGHAAGDQLMRQVTAVLQRRLREGDTLARLGGDEFGVLLENCAPDNAARIADQLRQTVADFHFVWENRSFGITVSIGLVNVEDGLFTLADVLSAADAACYMAKDKGRNRVQIYHPEDSEVSLRQGEMEWVGRIQKALEEDRFVLYAQEIRGVAGVHDHGSHCELLIRMLDERGEIVPPMAFIPAAERYGLMPAIDRWVIRTAFATIARLRSERAEPPLDLCAINLSGASLTDERFLDFARAQFAHFAVPPELICFEITETVAIANLESAARFIHALKDLGCRFSLDDFGAGMSSFAYLKHLPVDYLKIDGGFVKDMADDVIDRAMVEAINSIGHVMGKKTIAEFVDSERVLKALRDIGVDFAQGYWVARPQPFGPRLRVAAVGA